VKNIQFWTRWNRWYVY